jgi:hypothetical protein
MFYSSFTGIPHDMMHCVDAPGQSYWQLLSQGGTAMASGGSWLLWINEDSGSAVLGPLAIARQAAQWAIQRKPALGRTVSANRTAVLVSETQWKMGGKTYGKHGPAGLAWDDDKVPLLQACALSLQDQGFLVDIVNEELLIKHTNRYRRVFVPGEPKLSKATEQLLHVLESRGATIVRNAPACPSGHDPDIHCINNARGCVFSLRKQVTSNRYVLHVIDLINPIRIGLSCNLSLPLKLTHVRAYPASVDVSTTWSDGRCTITLGEFEAHAAIVFHDPNAVMLYETNVKAETDR